MTRNILITLVLLAGLAFACEKEDDTPAGKRVDIYRLADYKTAVGSARIIDSTVMLDEDVLIPFNEMIAYNKKNHTFTVTEQIAEKLNDTGENPFHRTGFAVTVDQQVIYTGYFWAGYSSATCDWVIIDPLNYASKDDGAGNKLEVRLGYPTAFEGVPDQRNDRRILEVFRLHEKLKPF